MGTALRQSDGAMHEVVNDRVVAFSKRVHGRVAVVLRWVGPTLGAPHRDFATRARTFRSAYGRERTTTVSKKILTAVTVLAALAVPTMALADKHTITTPNITTARGSEDPKMTDVGHLSRKNTRDFVADPTGWSAGANLGFGLGDAYGVGFGGRAGYTLPGRVYVGGIVGYHIGNTAEALGVETRQKTWYFGPEAGYDLGVGKVILRPVLGLGLAFRNQNITGASDAQVAANVNASETDTRVYVAPGASVIYPIGNFFVGGDSRAMLMNGNNTITFMGTAGAHL